MIEPSGAVAIGVATAPEVATARVATVRLFYLDNLKAALIVAVVVFHVAITYGANGSWYYVEGRGGITTKALLTVLVAALQFFFMGLFFAISGYFTPGAYDRKGARRFLADRARRLGIPLVVFTVAISPFLEAFKSATSGGGWGAFWPSWRQHVEGWAPGPLWFVETLLVFSFVYAGWRQIAPAHRAGRTANVFAWPRLLTFMAGLVAVSFLVRLRYPIGAEWQHLQLAFYPQYIAMFALGVLARNGGWLAQLDHRLGRRWLATGVVTVVAIPVVLILGGAARDGGDLAPFFGGVHWQAVATAILEALILVGMSLGLPVLFRTRFAAPTRLWRLLAANAFTVYIIHPPVVLALTYACRDLPLPALLKFALLAPLCVAASVTVSHLFVRRIPGASWVL